MYTICIRDYDNKINYTKNKFKSYRSAVEKMFDIAYKYIYEKQGLMMDDENLITNENNIPNYRGKSIFYINRKINNVDKIYVNKVIRQYGIIYNNYIIKKKLRIEIYYAKCKPKQIKVNDDSEEYECNEQTKTHYCLVLDSLKDYQLKNINENGENIVN